MPASVFSQTAGEDFKPNSLAAGYGGSLVVKVRDPSAIYWNPALLSSAKDRELLISINKAFGFDFIGFNQFVPLYGTFGVALSRSSFLTDNVDRGTLAWGRKIVNGLSWGVNFDLSTLQDEWYAAAGWGIFIGNPNVGSLDYRWQDFKKSTLLDKLNFGFTMRNIPLSSKLYDTSARLGFSYLLPLEGILLNTGYHFRKGDNSSHLGLGFELNRNLTLFTGVQELEFDKWGVGMSYSQDNFIFNLAYSTELERILVTLSSRLGAKPADLASHYYERGTKYLKSSDYKSAISELKKYLFFDLHESKSDTARKLVLTLERRNAKRQFLADSLYTVADLLTAKGEAQSLRAALMLLKVLELDSNHVRANMKLMSLKPAIQDFIKKSLQDGANECDSENYAEAQTYFKRVLLFENDNESALSYLSKINQIYDEKSEELFVQGVVFFQQKNYKNARAAFKQSLDYYPGKQVALTYLNRTDNRLKEVEQEIKALLQSGQSLEQRKRYIAATIKYEEILKIDKANVEAKARIAKLKPKERLEKRALIQKREKVSLYLSQAEDSFQRKEWKNAVDLYSEVLAINAKNVKAIQGKKAAEKKLQIGTLLDAAQSDVKSENYLEAFNKYKKVLDLEPENDAAKTRLSDVKKNIDLLVEAHFNKGIKLYTEDNYQGAIIEWSEALKLNPDHTGSLEYKKQALERLKALKQMK